MTEYFVLVKEGVVYIKEGRFFSQLVGNSWERVEADSFDDALIKARAVTQATKPSHTQVYSAILSDITQELLRAEELHPSWPSDPVHAVAILVEEVGEAMREAIDIKLANKDAAKARLDTELVQAGAMCLRALLNLRAEAHKK